MALHCYSSTPTLTSSSSTVVQLLISRRSSTGVQLCKDGSTTALKRKDSERFRLSDGLLDSSLASPLCVTNSNDVPSRIPVD
jgi:hypothetical protein